MTQLDLALPGVLALLLSRTHQSSYRAGRLFGPSWASTLDQRLEIDGLGVVFVGEDGLLLAFPTPDQDPVLPADGPRWPLRREGDGYVLTDLDAGRELASPKMARSRRSATGLGTESSSLDAQVGQVRKQDLQIVIITLQP
jgi:hypothetical protein